MDLHSAANQLVQQKGQTCKLLFNSLGLTQMENKLQKSSSLCKIGQGCKNTLKNIFGNEPSIKSTAVTRTLFSPFGAEVDWKFFLPRMLTDSE